MFDSQGYAEAEHATLPAHHPAALGADTTSSPAMAVPPEPGDWPLQPAPLSPEAAGLSPRAEDTAEVMAHWGEPAGPDRQGPSAQHPAEPLLESAAPAGAPGTGDGHPEAGAWDFDAAWRPHEGGPGALDPSLRAEMGTRFGEDFSSVGVERGLSSTDQALGARAVSEEDRIAVDPGTLDAQHSPEGRQIIAEELAHVVQKRRGRIVPDEVDEASGGPVAAQGPGERAHLEREAEHAAARAAQGEPAGIAAGAQAPARQFNLWGSVQATGSWLGTKARQTAGWLRRLGQPSGQQTATSAPAPVSAGKDDLVDLATPERRQHILDGEIKSNPDGTIKYGGGHRAGTGFPDKTEFPEHWTDDTAMHHVSDVATDPQSIPDPNNSPKLFDKNGNPIKRIHYGVRDGVKLKVVQEAPTGKIVSGYPHEVLDPVTGKMVPAPKNPLTSVPKVQAAAAEPGPGPVPETPGAPRLGWGARLGSLLSKGFGALGVIGGGLQTLGGVRELRAGKTFDGGMDVSAGLSNVVGGGATLLGRTALGGLGFGLGATIDGAKDIYHGVKERNLEKGLVGGVKTTAGGLMIAGAATGNPILMGAGAITYGGALLYEHRKAIKDALVSSGRWIGGQASRAWNGVSAVGSKVMGSVGGAARAVGGYASRAAGSVGNAGRKLASFFGL